jgi:hypothetical protein
MGNPSKVATGRFSFVLKWLGGSGDQCIGTWGQKNHQHCVRALSEQRRWLFQHRNV